MCRQLSEVECRQVVKFKLEAQSDVTRHDHVDLAEFMIKSMRVY
jgi:hypothetical protein